MPHPAVPPSPACPEAPTVAPRGICPLALTTFIPRSHTPLGSPSLKPSNKPSFPLKSFIHSTNIPESPLRPPQPSPHGASRLEDTELDTVTTLGSPKVRGKYGAGGEWWEHTRKGCREMTAEILGNE